MSTASARPVSSTVLPPAPRPATAVVKYFPDQAVAQAMHPGIYKLALLCWAGLLTVFWVTFWSSAEALFVVAIGTVYAVMFFGVPWTMSRMGPPRPKPRSLAGFGRGRFATLYGPVTGWDALLQVILVPLALSLGGIAISSIIRSARAAY